MGACEKVRRSSDGRSGRKGEADLPSSISKYLAKQLTGILDKWVREIFVLTVHILTLFSYLALLLGLSHPLCFFSTFYPTEILALSFLIPDDEEIYSDVEGLILSQCKKYIYIFFKILLQRILFMLFPWYLLQKYCSICRW